MFFCSSFLQEEYPGHCYLRMGGEGEVLGYGDVQTARPHPHPGERVLVASHKYLDLFGVRSYILL